MRSLAPFNLSCCYSLSQIDRNSWETGKELYFYSTPTKALAKRRRKLKTWVNLRLFLARACVHLRWLAMTCAHFGRDQIYTQVKASFSPFGHLTQVNASWVTSINGLLANEIQDMSALKWVFSRLACTCEKTCLSFGHPTQVSTQVQLAPTCDYLPVRLSRALL